MNRQLLPWTPKQVDFLRQHYLTLGAHYVAEHTGHSYHSTRDKANTIGLKARSGLNHWSPEHLALMKEKYAELGVPGLMQLTGRSRAGVTGQARKMGLYKAEGRGTRTRTCNWTEQELASLREHYPTSTPAKVAQLINRPVGAVLAMAKRLKVRCLVKRSGRPSTWSEEQLLVLRTHYAAGMPVPELCELLGGRQKNSVFSMAAELGLKRPARVKPEPVAKAPKVAKVAKLKPAPEPVADKELQRLVKQKAKAKAAKLAAAPEKPKKWFQYPMSSPEYKAGFAALTAGKKPTTILDTNGRPATVWRNAA